MTDQTTADLRIRALDRAHALAEQWQGDQTPITRAHAAELLMETIQLHGWTQTTAAPGRHLTPVADDGAARQATQSGNPFLFAADRVEELVTTLRAARQAGGQQSDTTTPERCSDWPECNHPFMLDGCACRPWTRQTTPARYLEPGDSIEMISGWERGADCPHHASAPAAGPDDTQTGTDRAAVYFAAADRIALDLVPTGDVAPGYRHAITDVVRLLRRLGDEEASR